MKTSFYYNFVKKTFENILKSNKNGLKKYLKNKEINFIFCA